MPKRLALVSAFISSIAAAAFAQARQLQADAPATPLAMVEVKASLDAVRQNDSASRSVVGHDELVKYGDATVLDSLKRLPGVTVGSGGVSMRGLGSGYTQVLAPDRPRGELYADASASLERADTSQTRRSLRVQYEQKFE